MKGKMFVAWVIATVILVLGGFCIGMTEDAQSRVLNSRRSKIEMQLARYKHAQEVCGKDNVEEESEWVSAREEFLGTYTCEDFREAVKTPEERKLSREEQILYDRYREYRREGGVYDFEDGRSGTNKG